MPKSEFSPKRACHIDEATGLSNEEIVFTVKAGADLEEIRLVLSSQVAMADEESQPGQVAVELELPVSHGIPDLLNRSKGQLSDLAVANLGYHFGPEFHLVQVLCL